MNRQTITGYVCSIADMRRLSDHKAASMTLACISENKIKYVPVITQDYKAAKKIKNGTRLRVSGYMNAHTYLTKEFNKTTVEEMIADVITEN